MKIIVTKINKEMTLGDVTGIILEINLCINDI